jgi:hypothetical protein
MPNNPAENFGPQYEALGVAIDRLEGETAVAYQAFLIYSGLIGKDRTAERVADKTHFPVTSVKAWMSQNQWQDRVANVDAQRWLIDYQEKQKLTEDDNKRFIEENRHIKRETIRAGKKMLQVANNLLDSATMADEIRETGYVITADNRSVPTTTQIFMKAKVSDIPRLVDTAIKASRLAQDLPTEIIDNLVAGTPGSRDLSQLTEAEIEELAQENRKKLNFLTGVNKLDTIG